MINLFLKEKRSWIFFFVCLQLFLLFVAYIDTSLPFSSMLYFVFLSAIIFTVFLVFRYQKETIFYKQLRDLEKNLDLSQLQEADRPFEKLVEHAIKEQTAHLKQLSSRNIWALELEKDELLAWIHEVKTPLTAMRLMIDRLEDPQTKKQLTYEWLRIHLLLDQQLHQRRIPSIENDLYMEHIELETIIFDEIKTLQSWCIQKGIGFNIELEAASVLSDAKWLAFILRQLLTNAVKYSEAADIEIHSTMHNGKVTLAIKDDGIGISSRDLPRIFDKGFTSTSNHDNQAATGMGLYLAKKAADSLSIAIEADSKLGDGSTFTLTFSKSNKFVDMMSM
jgi:OmpR family two-component system bacitracin resistance sensor histidine kinase BceS